MALSSKSVTHPNNNNDKEGNLLNNLLNKSSKAYVIRSFSVPQKYFQVLRNFEELVQRERTKFSWLVIKALGEYVTRHHPGNPQLLLTKYVRTKVKCGLCGEYSERVWRVEYVGGIIPSCKSCIEEKREKGLVVKVLGLI